MTVTAFERLEKLAPLEGKKETRRGDRKGKRS